MDPIISECYLVKNFTKNQIDNFINSSMTRTYFKNEIIFSEGDLGESVYLLLEGKVFLERRLKNKIPVPPFQITIVKHGQIFGEMAFIEQNVRSATARAKSNVKILEIKSGALSKLIISDPDFGIKITTNIAYILSKRLRRMNEQWLKSVSTGLSYLEYEYQF